MQEKPKAKDPTHEKSKAKAHNIFWAYRLSQRLHLLKRDQIEVDASPEQCLEHLKKMRSQDPHHFFKVGMINNYKGYDVIIRSLNRIRRRPQRDSSIEEAFILCHMEGKGNKTIISLQVGLGKAILEDLIIGLWVLPIMLVLVFLNVVFNSGTALLVLVLPFLLFMLVFVVFGMSLYPMSICDRDKMLEFIVAYMFTIEEKPTSKHEIDLMSASKASQLER